MSDADRMRLPRFSAVLYTCALTSFACSSGTSSDANEHVGGSSASASGAPSTTAGASNTGASGNTVGGANNAGANNGGANNAGANNGGANSAGANNAGANTAGATNTAGAAGTSAGSGGAGNGGSGAAGAAGAAGATTTFPPNCTCLGLGPPACTPTGHVTYTLAKVASPTADQQSAYDAITCAMDGAVAYYNCNTSITKALNVTYDTSVPTADGNFNGSVRFGGHDYMECVTGMHEIAHTVGVGTAPKWPTYSVGGVFTGTTAIAQLRAITGNATDVLHSDTQHFWPYGLNYTSEAGSTADLIDHCLMVTAIRKDLGLQ